MEQTPEGQRVLDTVQAEDERKHGLASGLYKSVKEQLQKFQSELADDEETVVMLANFGTAKTIVVTDIVYKLPHLIIINGFDGEQQCQILQHVTQVSLMLSRKKVAPHTIPRRIGFTP